MQDKTGKERPWLYRGIRATELLGLLSLLYGLASSEWLTAAVGAGFIVASHQVYRRWFPVIRQRDDRSMGMSDGDGGY